MNPKETHPSTDPFDIAQSGPTIHPINQPRKPYISPAILHELALETRADSVLGVDPVFDHRNEILGIPTE